MNPPIYRAINPPCAGPFARLMSRPAFRPALPGGKACLHVCGYGGRNVTMAGVAQLVRAPVCGTGGRRFDTGHSPHLSRHGRLFGQPVPRGLHAAGVAELVDALDLGSSGENRGGSSPSARTMSMSVAGGPNRRLHARYISGRHATWAWANRLLQRKRVR